MDIARKWHSRVSKAKIRESRGSRALNENHHGGFGWLRMDEINSP